MSFTAQYANSENTVILRSDMPSVSIPSDPANRHYAEILKEGVVIADYESPPASTNPNGYPLEPYLFFVMLKILGKEAAAEAAVNAIPDATHKAVARAKWKHATRFDRNDPLFSQLAPVVGLTNSQIDTAWMQAKEF